ncbi:MAG: molybdenum cofactor biosynthesis protein [Chloroflexi bacterium]|nr:molybdenum cofactor biosynthesis protein [Chloroflexota bacterium]
MKPFGALLSFEEAKKVVAANIEPVSRVETINIDEAVGRVLAEDIVATLSIPSFNRAAMDGYAVKAKDTFNSGQLNPKVLNLVGELHAGETPRERVGGGQCLQIATGAMMPQGADAVVMVEDTEAENGRVKVFKSIYPGANVGKKGEDIREGALVLREGFVLEPGRVGVLASQGLNQIRVYEKPRVAILPTGEEVVEVGKKLRQGQLYDINSHTVASVVKANGGMPYRVGIAGDNLDELRATIAEALKSDLVVLSGGSSVGERDLLVDVLQDWGEILFHGIQVKPGKPTIFARLQGKPLFGMPGYPTSCLINTYLFLLPVIRQMAHLPPRRGETVEAKLSRRVPGSVGRRQFLTVKIENGEAVPVFKESGAITTVAEADGYIEIAENIDLLEKGEPVTVTLF